MGVRRPTATLSRDPALVLLVLVVAACGAKHASVEAVYNEGYRELESGNLEIAKAKAEEGLQRARDSGQPGWEWAFEVLDTEVLVTQLRSAEALDRLDAWLAESRPNDVVLARAFMTRGYARCLAPDGEDAHSRAVADLEKAFHIATTLNAGKVATEVMLRQGTCAVARSDRDAAEDIYRETMRMARRQKLQLIEAQSATGLGLIRVRTSEFDDAVRWLRRSQDLAADLPAEGLRFRILGNLGWAYDRLGDYERAVQVLSRAEPLARKLGYVGDRRIVLTNLARALYRLGDHAGAEAAYGRAAAVAREIQDPARAAEMQAGIHVSLATLALERRRYEEAAAKADEALRIYTEIGYETARQRTLLLMGEIAARQGETTRAEALFKGVFDSPQAEPNLVWEARVALARLHVQAGRPAAAEAEFRHAFELMETSFAQLIEAELQLPFFSNLGRFHDEYVDFLVTQGRVTEALEAADDSRARLLRERLLDTSATPTSGTDYPGLARDLDALLLFYSTASERSFLWVVAADGIELLSLPGEEALEALVATYQARILESRDPLREADFEGSELYRLLVEPVSAAMASAERVIIVPDGPLHQLNFETLIVSDVQPHYLIEDAVLTRAPALRLLRAETESWSAREPSLLVLGDPAVPDEGEFPPLPFSGTEVASIADLFDPRSRQIHSGPQAAPSAYREADPEQFTYVHFAAHAQANPVVPLDSAVVLSAAGDEYKLYARDIISLPLSAELVTLSACRSAGGRAFAGEGLVGLSWAFLSAGARNVIGGLWPVEDASTAELMTRLYRELVAGAEPAVALRRAKLELLRSDTAYRKPYYWAPFVTYTSRAGSQSQMRSTASNRSAQESSSSASPGSSPSASEATAASARAPSKST